jgi:uncharacterized repeat protein (TIGR01451 family)
MLDKRHWQTLWRRTSRSAAIASRISTSRTSLSLGFAILLAATSAFAQSTTFNYSASVQTYTLPAGAIGVQIQASGAGGGGGGADSGGAGAAGGTGATVVGTYTAAAGTVLNIYVGGGGAPGYTSNYGHTCANSAGAGGLSPGAFAGGAGGQAGCSGWSGGGAGGGAASVVASTTGGTLVVAGGGGGGQGGSLNSTSVPSQSATQLGALPTSVGGVGANLGSLDGGGGGGGGGGCPGGVGGSYHKDSTGTAYGTAAGAGSSCANTTLVTNFSIVGATGGAGGAGDPANTGSTDVGGKAGTSGSVTITPIFGADVSATVSFPASVNAGQSVAGTVLFTNSGPATASGNSFSLTLTSKLAPAPVLTGLPTGVSYTYVAATGVVTLSGMPTTLASGSSLGPITVSYTQPASGTSSVTAVFNTTTSDPNAANNTASATVAGNPVADVATALAFPASVNAGQAVNGTLTFTNNGPSTAGGLTYTLTLPPNLATAPTITALPTGATSTYVAATGVVNLAGMPSTLATATTIGPIAISYTQPGAATSTVTASLNTTTTDSNPANNSASATIAGSAVVDVATALAFPASVNAGQAVSGTLTFTNNGPSTASGLTYTLSVPANLATAPTITALPTGATSTYSAATGALTLAGMPTTLATATNIGPITISYTQPGAASSTVSAAINTSTTDSNPVNNSATATIAGNAVADVAAALAFPATVNAGQLVAGTITFTNTGPSTATGLTYTLNLAPNLATAPTITALPTGAGYSYAAATGVVTLTGLPATLATGTNIGPISVSYAQPGAATSTVSASINTVTTDSNPANNNASLTIAGNPVADVATALLFPASADAGKPVTGTVTFTNNGPSTASGLTFNLSLAPNLVPAPTLGGLPTGASYSYAAATGVVSLTGIPVTLAATTSLGPITVSYTQPGTATSAVSASINTTTTDSNPANNSATVTIAGNPIADVATAFVFPASVDAGKPVTGTLTFTNSGASTASGLTYTLTLPPNLATAPTLSGLPTGASYNYVPATGVVTLAGMPATLAASAMIGPITVSFTQPGAATSTVSASIATTTTDSNPANNAATVTITGHSVADVAVSLTFPATIDAGKPVVGTLTFTNNGPSAATGLTYTLNLPVNLTVAPTITALPTGASYSYAAATGVVTLAGMPTTLTTATNIGPITVAYNQPGAATSTVSASIATITTDSNPANNSATATIAGNLIADVATALAFPANTDAGKPVAGTLTFTNYGPSTASGLTYTLTLPPNLVSAPAITALPTGATYSYAAATGVVTLSGLPANLAPNTSIGPITVGYTQPGTATSTVSAAIATTTADSNPANNGASVTIAGNQLADLATALSFPPNVNAGQAIIGTLLFTNSGPSSANGLSYTLTLPAALATSPTLSGLPAGASYSYASATGVVSLSGMPTTLAASTSIGPVTVSYTQPPKGSSLVSASIAATTADPNPANNNATASIAGNAVADVAATLSFPSKVNAGQIVTGTVMFTNAGPSTATAVNFNLTLPANLAEPPTPSFPSGVTYSYAPSTGVVTLNGTPTTLAAGASFGPITVSYRQPGTATSSLSAAVSTTTTDPNLLNNAASAVVQGAAQADLAVSLSLPANVNAGQAVRGSLLYVNNGPSTALAPSFSLSLPANLATQPTIAGLPAGASYTYVPATGVITFSGMPTSLAAAATVGPVTLDFTQPPSGTSSVSAAIASTTSDANPTNNTATATVTGVPVADAAVSLVFPARVNAGLTVTGTVLFTNSGPSPATGTVFSLSLPINLSIAPTLGGLPNGVTYNYTAATGVVSLTGMPATLAAGASLGPINISYSQPSSGSSSVSASISSPTKDPNPTNNSATDTITGAAAGLLGTVYIDTNQDGVFDAGDTPVAGTTVQLLSASRVIATVTTNALGAYSFAGEPPGAYTVVVTPATGYLAASPASVSVSLNGGAPAVVNFGQIPAAAVGSLVMTKMTPLVNISAGESVPYTITATNSKNTPLDTVTVADLIPAGFRYRTGSGSVNGKKQDPTVNGRQLLWTHLTFAAGEKKTFTLVLTAGAGVVGGEFVNEAMGYNGLTNTLISNVASATVRITADPTFDCPDLIGKVFDDKNANGREDPGEPGIAGVRLVTAQGLLVTTDSEGRYHIACPILPDAEIGTNFIVKVDERTLPSGYRLTTDNPETVRLTAGKVSKLNFGAAIHRVVRIELKDSAFDGEQLRADVRARLDTLVASLKDEAVIVRLAYEASTEPEELVAKRMRAVDATLASLWTANACRYPLQIEDDIVRSLKPAPTGPGATP